MKQYINALPNGAVLKGKSCEYHIDRVLGQGAFGITYLASVKVKMAGSLGTIDANVKVAIKEFFMGEVNGRTKEGTVEGLTEGSMPYKYKQRFRKEAESLSKLNHPNIVKVIDFIEANETFYYVMEYIDGEDLYRYMDGQPLPTDEAISIIKEVGKALTYMHEEKNMMHLDLKPGNIMRRRSDGHIFLIDFGLTKVFDDNGKPETSTTIGQGTPGYAPLEQNSTSVKNKSFRPTIDVYSLGATLLKLLTAEAVPPASDVLNDDKLLEGILSRHSVDRNIKDAILKAMDPKPKQRTSSVRQFVHEIENSPDENTQDVEATVYDSIFSNRDKTKTAPQKTPFQQLPISEDKNRETIISPHLNELQKKKNRLSGNEKRFYFCLCFIILTIFAIFVYNKYVYMDETEKSLNEKTTTWNTLCPDNKHPHFINLALPSGTKWACCNVGASKPEDTGELFAWGETRSKSEYVRKNYIYYRNNGDYFVEIGDNIQGTFKDAATENWGQSWGTPSSEQYSELLKYCKCEWVVTDGTKEKGMKFTASNGNMIYLPASAFSGIVGQYWSSNRKSSENAYYLMLKAEEVNSQKWMTKSEGLSIRPIYIEKRENNSNPQITDISQICPDERHPHAIDLGLPSGTKWACCNVGSANPVDRGKDYAWGETKSKSEYAWDNYLHCSGTHNSCRKLGNISGTMYDAASKTWGEDWEMPTAAKFKELTKYCQSKWLVIKGKTRGVLLEGLNHNKIFFPEDISRWDKKPLEFSLIWSSQCVDKFPSLIGSDSVATCMYFGKEKILMLNNRRFAGLKIRPVAK